MQELILPHNWNPRPYQVPVFNYFEDGGKRAVLRWHRRAGKDDCALHLTATQMVERVGNYWHLLPQYEQARKAIWDSVNPHTGKKRIDEAFPLELRKRTRDKDMMIEFLNGSTWQLGGSDSYNTLVGSSPVGIVFSEYALGDPGAWNFLRPMLLENDGWAVFISTVRGKNHFYKLGEFAKQSENWFFSEVNADKSGVFTAKQLENERQELILSNVDEEEGEAIYLQEYFNDPTAAVPGAYYAKLMRKAQLEDRVGNFPYNPGVEVTTAWDLGMSDSTAIWFFQRNGRAIDFIDYYEANNVGLDHYAKVLREKPYIYSKRNIFPHDMEVKELGTGKTRRQTLKDLGIEGIVLPKLAVIEGIHSVRQILPRCRFDEKKCARGVEALQMYRKIYNDKTKIYSPSPLHDWTSHAADAFRYFATGFEEGATEKAQTRTKKQFQQVVDYDPLTGQIY